VFLEEGECSNISWASDRQEGKAAMERMEGKKKLDTFMLI